MEHIQHLREITLTCPEAPVMVIEELLAEGHDTGEALTQHQLPDLELRVHELPVDVPLLGVEGPAHKAVQVAEARCAVGVGLVLAELVVPHVLAGPPQRTLLPAL